MLIDPELHDQSGTLSARGGQRQCCGGDLALAPSATTPRTGCDAIDCADLAGHRSGDRVLQPGGEPGSGQDLNGGFGESASGAEDLDAALTLLDPHHLDEAVERDVTDPLGGALVDASGEHAAARAGRLETLGRDHHTPTARLVTADLDNVVLGQANNTDATLRAASAIGVNTFVVLSVGCLKNTQPRAGPRAPTSRHDHAEDQRPDLC